MNGQVSYISSLSFKVSLQIGKGEIPRTCYFSLFAFLHVSSIQNVKMSRALKKHKLDATSFTSVPGATVQSVRDLKLQEVWEHCLLDVAKGF